MVGGNAPTTSSVADAVLPVRVLVAVTVPVVLVRLPVLVAITFSVSVQALLLAMVAPESETLPVPGTAVAAPPQVLLNPLGLAITIPAGKVSVNATPLSDTAPFGLASVNVNAVVPFKSTAFAAKALAIVGGAPAKFGVNAPKVLAVALLAEG